MGFDPNQPRQQNGRWKDDDRSEPVDDLETERTEPVGDTYTMSSARKTIERSKWSRSRRSSRIMDGYSRWDLPDPTDTEMGRHITDLFDREAMRQTGDPEHWDWMRMRNNVELELYTEGNGWERRGRKPLDPGEQKRLIDSTGAGFTSSMATPQDYGAVGYAAIDRMEPGLIERYSDPEGRWRDQYRQRHQPAQSTKPKEPQPPAQAHAEHPQTLTGDTPEIRGITTVPLNDLTLANIEGVRVPPTGYDEGMRALADGSARIGANGITDGRGRPISVRALKDSPHSRRLIRRVLTGDGLAALKPSERKAVFRQAFDAASPYQRRKAMDGPNARYVPAATMARSLRRRRDERQAMDILKRVHWQDRTASAAIIRNGYPKDRHTAMMFINGTKDRDRRTLTRGPRKGVTEYYGTAARRYLRIKFNSAGMRGAPSERDMRRLHATFHRMHGDPAAEGAALYQLAYGERNGGVLSRNGIAAERLCYEGGVSREGMRAFLDLERGRQEPGSSRLHPDQERLTAFRANLHAMAAAADRMPPVSDEAARMPVGDAERRGLAEAYGNRTLDR